MKFKVLRESNSRTIEQELEEMYTLHNIKDIHFSTSQNNVGGIFYSVLVVYEEKK